MSKIICRICLRTDLQTRDIGEELIDFHDEITEYAIYENHALKYCSMCEHLLLKFYKFRRKCRKANKILKTVKRAKNGVFPSHLHELLPQSLLTYNIPSTLQFNIYNDNEPFTEELVIKQENVKDELGNDIERNDHLEATDTLQINDLQANFVHTNVSGNSYILQTFNVSEILNSKRADIKKKTLTDLADIDLENEDKPEENSNPLSLLKVQSTLEKTQKCEQNANHFKVKQEDCSSDLQEDDYNEDSSDTELITELEKQIRTESKACKKYKNPLSLFKLSNIEKSRKYEERNANQFEVKQNDGYEDSSDTEMINEFEKRIQAANKASRKKGSSGRTPRPKQPLKNRKEYEKVFEIQLFATEQEAKDELALRKSTERYLAAEHKCQICYMVFKYSKQMEFHMRWHDPSAGEYECAICKMRFQNRTAVVKHKNGAHYGKFKCRKCPLITYHKMAMATHYQCHAGVIFTCKLCNRTFNHSSTYKTHLRLRHMTEHVCVTCAQTFVSQKGLSAHRTKKHKTKSKVDKDATAHCAPCGLTFANEQVYTVHIMNTESHRDLANSIVACKLCGVRFEGKEDLKDHKRSQHFNRKHVKTWTKTNTNKTKDTYNCSICGVEGTSNTWVLKHFEFAHPESAYAADLTRRRQHMCEACGKCYTTIYALRDHINTHTGAKPYSCVKCPARFSSRSHLLLHEERHAPAKRVCTHCGKKFVSASNLSNHMRSHIQDRRYKCSLCPKGFLHSATLREHVRGVHHHVRRARGARHPAPATP